MYHKIKELAEAEVALQNKGAMDSALREIGALAELKITQAAFNPEKIVLMELAKGGTVFLDGRFVKLAEGESPANPDDFPFARNETATAAFNKAENEALVMAKVRAELASKDPKMADAAALVLKHLIDFDVQRKRMR